MLNKFVGVINQGGLVINMDTNFSPEDGFFLTFLGAWSSVNEGLWKNNAGTILLVIIFFLSFAIAMSTLRAYLIHKINSKGNSSVKFSPKLHSCFFIIIFMVTLVSLAYNAYNFNCFELSDLIVVGGALLLWIFYICISVIAGTKQVTITTAYQENNLNI